MHIANIQAYSFIHEVSLTCWIFFMAVWSIWHRWVEIWRGGLTRVSQIFSRSAKSCIWKKKHPKHSGLLGALSCKVAYQERTWGSWRTSSWTQASNMSLLLCKIKRGSPSALFNVAEGVPGVQCPAVGSPVQERSRHTGDSPVKGYKDG